MSRTIALASFVAILALFTQDGFSPFAATAHAESATSASSSPKLDVPYVPTPQPVVDKMLDMAGVTKNDVVIDLGSGDGRIPVTAAKQYGAKAIGVDINPERIREAQQNARAAGVEDKVEFKQQDLFKTDLGEATVLTMYLLAGVNMKLRPRILTELEPGTRVVSHSFDMGDWKPERTETVDGRTIHFWTVPDCSQPSPEATICKIVKSAESKP
ncbi:MAG: class I SAM-dependent methyltransferase [Hyphomicrobium sp.]|nr:class I SAM-dependent methyltransferase [Hyphomicrobium sp.]